MGSEMCIRDSSWTLTVARGAAGATSAEAPLRARAATIFCLRFWGCGERDGPAGSGKTLAQALSGLERGASTASRRRHGPTSNERRTTSAPERWRRARPPPKRAPGHKSLFLRSFGARTRPGSTSERSGSVVPPLSLGAPSNEGFW